MLVIREHETGAASWWRLSAWVAAGCVLAFGAASLWAAEGGAAGRTNAAAAAVASERPPEQLGAGDKVSFFIEEDPERAGTSAREYIVSPQGLLNFPVSFSPSSDAMISIEAKGKSIAQVKAELKAKLDQDFYYNATVFLMLTEQRPRESTVYFTGEVQGKILKFGSTETVTLFDAIMRQGYSEFANLKKVKLHRLNPLTKRPETKVYDVKEMMQGDRSKNIPLQDGDQVEIPQVVVKFFN